MICESQVDTGRVVDLPLHLCRRNVCMESVIIFFIHLVDPQVCSSYEGFPK